MRHTAEREGFELPPLRIAVQNQIPVTSGLGSSAAATAAGVALAFAVGNRPSRREIMLKYAAAVEGLFRSEDAAVQASLGAAMLEGYQAAERDRRVTVMSILATYAGVDWDEATKDL